MPSPFSSEIDQVPQIWMRSGSRVCQIWLLRRLTNCKAKDYSFGKKSFRFCIYYSGIHLLFDFDFRYLRNFHSFFHCELIFYYFGCSSFWIVGSRSSATLSIPQLQCFS
jgi:hypothetical protein